MSDPNWTAMTFFPEAKVRIGDDAALRLQRVFRFLRDKGKATWGPLTNKNGGFKIRFNGFGTQEIVHGYVDGNLVIWRGRLDLEKPAQRQLFERLNALEEHFECNVENPSRFELPLEKWGHRVDELLDTFESMLRAES